MNNYCPESQIHINGQIYPNMDVAYSASKAVCRSVEHPRLTRFYAPSIGTFLKRYDQSVNVVHERAGQLMASELVTTEVILPGNLHFCVDIEGLESVIALSFINGVSKYEALSSDDLCHFLKSSSEQSKEVVFLEKVDEIVKAELRTNMDDSNAKSRMENLFVSYHALIKRHGLSRILEDNQKFAVYHVLSAIRPNILKERLTSDLEFSHHELRKTF